MTMFDLEGLEQPERNGFHTSGIKKLRDAAEKGDIEKVVDIVDSITDVLFVPHAIDYNTYLKKVIEPLLENKDINPECLYQYLETEPDKEQIDCILNILVEYEEFDYEAWKNGDAKSRENMLSYLDYHIQEVNHRPRKFTTIFVEDLGDPTGKMGECEGEYEVVEYDGYCEDVFDATILLNSRCLEDDSQEAYIDALHFMIYAGRKAYQFYNLYEREVHPDIEAVERWRDNPDGCDEKDAKGFADKVIRAYKKYLDS